MEDYPGWVQDFEETSEDVICDVLMLEAAFSRLLDRLSQHAVALYPCIAAAGVGNTWVRKTRF